MKIQYKEFKEKYPKEYEYLVERGVLHVLTSKEHIENEYIDKNLKGVKIKCLPRGYWNEKTVNKLISQISPNFKGFSERFPGAYDYIERSEKRLEFRRKIGRRVDDRNSLEVGRKFKTKKEFRLKENYHYNKVITNKQMHLLTHFETLPYSVEKNTYEKCRRVAEKYNSVSDFRKNDLNIYNKIMLKKWLDLIPYKKDFNQKPKNYWTKKLVIEKIKETNSWNEFRKLYPGAYSAAKKFKIKKGEFYKKKKITKRDCRELAKKYESRGDFRKKKEDITTSLKLMGF